MKLKQWLVLSIVVLFILMFGTLAIQREIIKNRTIESNARLEALKEYKSDLKRSRAKDSTEVAELKAMQLSKKEIKELFPNVEKILENVDKRLGDVESIVQISSHQEVNNIHTYLRDSTITDTTKVKVASFSNKWLKFSEIIYSNGLVEPRWESQDSLDIILDKGRGSKKFIFEWWRYGTKEYPLTINNKNPYNHIYYAKYLKVRNKKDNGK